MVLAKQLREVMQNHQQDTESTLKNFKNKFQEKPKIMSTKVLKPHTFNNVWIDCGSGKFRKYGAKNFMWHSNNWVYIAPVRCGSWDSSANKRPIKSRCPIIVSQWKVNPGARRGCVTNKDWLKNLIFFNHKKQKMSTWRGKYPKKFQEKNIYPVLVT